MTMDDSIKRWTAKRKTALVIELIQGRTTVAEASRSFDLTPSEIEGWQVRKRAIGIRPRIQAVPSVATAPNERWSTDLARVWTGKDGWASLALVIDCHTRELLGWHLSRSGKATTASAALEHALIARFGTLGRVDREFLLRSDNGLVFTSRHFTALVRSYHRSQEVITPHCPQQIGMVERPVRTLKEQRGHRHRFESIQHATRLIGDWICFHNTRRPHQALAMRTPAEAFKLAPQTEQIPPGRYSPPDRTSDICHEHLKEGILNSPRTGAGSADALR